MYRKLKSFAPSAFLSAIAFSLLILFSFISGCNGGGSGDGDFNTTTYYRDSDSDGYGDPNNSTENESQPSGYVLDNTDCDDTDASINPGQTEVPYNGKDDDCNPNTLNDDLDNDGYQSDTDCDDDNSSVNPGAAEICDDNIDNDCDGYLDAADSDCAGINPTFTGSVLYFDTMRGLQTTELKGKIFDKGFSFSGWFNFMRMSAKSLDIIGFDNFFIRHQDEGIIHISLSGSSANLSGLATKKWNNLAVTYDLSTIHFYLNGILVETSEASGPIEFTQLESDISIIGGLGQGFDGYASQIKIWNRGLSTEELRFEINRMDSSNSEGIAHQWLLDEGTGKLASDSVGNVDFEVLSPYWIDLDSPYEIVHESVLRVTDEEKLLPYPGAFGSADLNQDGHPDVFYHGSAFHFDHILKTPLLAIQNDGEGTFSDASDSLIDGGLYYKRTPSGRETIVADLNGDGFDDIFIGQHGGHGSTEGESEANCLLLSNGNSGKLYPSESTIMSPPCTLSDPEFFGQKPCISDYGGTGDIYYPDNNASLVPIDIRIYNHGVTSGDIDNDGDIDIYVGHGGSPPPDIGIKPVLSYFLINDGNGNFTANWQMVPNKAFYTEHRWNESNQNFDEGYSIFKLKDLDGDGYLDLVMFGGSPISNLAPHQPSDQFDVEQEYWDASVHDLIAWGTGGGFGENYTILDKDSLFPYCEITIITTDIDMDGDIDIIATKKLSNADGQYIQVFANNGNRTFTDVTQQSIPQDREIGQTLFTFSSEMREIDFNGDQCPDFYIQTFFGFENMYSDQPYIMWLNNCKGYFTPIERRFVGKLGLMIPLDADGDGDIDFVSQTRGHYSNETFSWDHTLLRRIGDINMDKYIDTDRDGLRDIDDIDDDNDGVNDSEDAFPKDKYES